MKQIKILINDDDSGLEKRFSSLEKAISNKNDNSFIINELRDLRDKIDNKAEKTSNSFESKISKLDDRMSNVYKMMASKIESINKNNVNKNFKEIKNLFVNHSKQIVYKMQPKKQDNSRLEQKIDSVNNSLRNELVKRPIVVNNTTINEGSSSSIMPFAA